MGLPMMAGGPIEKYLQATSKSRSTLDAEVARGETGATVVFAAEILFHALQDVCVAIETLGGSLPKSKT